MKIELTEEEAKLVLASLDYTVEQNSDFMGDAKVYNAMREYNGKLRNIHNKINDERMKEYGK
jgi:hypothetical protein